MHCQWLGEAKLIYYTKHGTTLGSNLCVKMQSANALPGSFRPSSWRPEEPVFFSSFFLFFFLRRSTHIHCKTKQKQNKNNLFPLLVLSTAVSCTNWESSITAECLLQKVSFNAAPTFKEAWLWRDTLLQQNVALPLALHPLCSLLCFPAGFKPVHQMLVVSDSSFIWSCVEDYRRHNTRVTFSINQCDPSRRVMWHLHGLSSSNTWLSTIIVARAGLMHIYGFVCFHVK